MDLLLLLKALILGVVEGLTEFLPVSSTGHLILAGDLLDFNDERGKLFEIVIQSGAILAVCWEFRAKIVEVVRGLPRDPGARRFALNIFAAFLPPQVPGWTFAVLLPAIFTIEVGWYTIVALLFSADRPRAAYLRWKRWFDRGAGTVMGALGIRLILGAGRV